MYKEERFNSISHMIGAVGSMIGLVFLVVIASRQGDPWKIVSFSIYGFTLLLLYVFSTLYHSLLGKAKAVFRILDHNAIYLLIAGTYTPFTLVMLRGEWGWSIFGIVWGLAVLGIVLESLPRKGRRIFPIIIYLFMGWIVLIAIKPLLKVFPPAGLIWLFAGGLFYTFGIFFYAGGRKIPYFHGVWHLFVLTGSTCHFFAVLLYIA
jgi:hemolysin III